MSRCQAEASPSLCPGATSPRFAADSRAAAAAEFSLILPIMIILLAMSVVGGEGLAIAHQVTTTARTVTDLVTQCSSMAPTDISAILGAAAKTMTPYDSANLSIVVSELQVDGSGKATVTWSYPAFNGVARPTGQTVAMPGSINQPNATLILGEVTYTYQPLNIFKTFGSIPLTDSSYMSPRVSPTVVITNGQTFTGCTL